MEAIQLGDPTKDDVQEILKTSRTTEAQEMTE